MTRIALLLLPALFLSAPLRAETVFDGVDVYGTERLTAEEAMKRYRSDLEGLARIKSRKGKGSEKPAQQYVEKLSAKIKAEFGFAWVGVAWLESFAEGKRKGFATIDVVEPKDKATRMPFRAIAGRNVEDPAGLLAEWDAYNETGWQLFKIGQISHDQSTCVSFFCEWGAQTPELKAYEQKFVAEAPGSKDGLLAVLRGDRDPKKRKNAVFLLAFLRDPNESSKILTEALTDPDVGVRSAALRVYADLAVHHKDVTLPTYEITIALDDPQTEGRNKALAVVAGMAGNDTYRRYLIDKAGMQMLRLLQQGQPAIQDTAYAALGILAKEGYDRRDLESWRRWIEREQAAAPK